MDAQMNIPNTETPSEASQSSAKKRSRLRVWLVVVVLGFAGLVGWMFWPTESEEDPYSLSRADGKSRFWVTRSPQMQMPANLNLVQRSVWAWKQFLQTHRTRNRTFFTFAASPVQLCSIHGLLNNCMEVTGTHYYVAVEIAGGVQFGNSSVLNGAQWVAAFENSIETSGPVICYDFAGKANFQDTLVLIRERPGVVKIIPKTKLADYRKAGLAK
jgi:hypothetical protein